MAKFAEKLTILQASNEILLDRIYYAKKTLVTKPLLSSEKLRKIHEAVDKHFPEIPPAIEKISGFETIKARTDEFLDEFQQHYHALLDVVEFKHATLELLKEISDSIVALRFEENTELMLAFMNLFVGYAQLNVLVGQIADRKMLCVLYATAHKVKESFAEPNYAKIAQYIQEFDSPIRKMQDELTSLSSRVGETLMSLVMTYSKCMTTSVLKKENALSLINNPEKLTVPIHDHFRFELVYLSRFYQWIIYGFLLCPQSLQPDGAIDLLKTALQDAWVAPVFRDEVLLVHDEFDKLFGWFKLAVDKKWKKNLAEFTTGAVAQAGQSHKERRSYLKQEMHQLLNIVTDRPGLFGPKIQVIFAALSLASEEIFWYLRHLGQTPPKSKAKYAEETYRDNNAVIELIYLVERLSALVTKHKKIIQTYYIEYLNGPDHDRVKEALAAATQRIQLDAGVSKILQAVVQGLKDASPSLVESGKSVDLEPLRLNWFRAVATFSSVQSSVRLVQLKDLVYKTQLSISHSRNVDRIDKLVKSFAPIHEMYYFPKEVDAIFNAGIDAATGIYIMSMVTCISSYPANATRALPEERVAIGQISIQLAEEKIKKICLKIQNFTEILMSQHGFAKLTELAEPSYGANLMIFKQQQQQMKEAKNQQPPSFPFAGMESRASVRGDQFLKSLRYYEVSIMALSGVIREIGDLVVYDQSLSAVQYLRELLQIAFQKYILAVVMPQDTMSTLSMAMKHINLYIQALKVVERATGISAMEITRKAFLHHFYDKNIGGPQGQLDALKVAPPKDSEGMLIHRMAFFYAELLDKRVASQDAPVAAAIFSPARQSFVSSSGAAGGFLPEHYLEINELCCLAEMVGPWGIRVIDNAIMRNCFRNIQNMKTILASNLEGLAALKKVFPKEPATSDAIRKLKSLETFARHCVNLGLNLHFRQLMRKGLAQANQAHVPYIQELACDIHSVLPLNMFGDPDLLPVDCLALDAGVPVRNSDPALHLIMRAHNTSREDQQRFELLPYMFTALFSTQFVLNSRFRTAPDAFLNNAGAMAIAMHEMLITLQAPTYASDPQGLQKLALSEKQFVESAASYLIRQKLIDPKLDLMSLWVFMDVYIQGTDLVTAETLSQFLPYGLIRASYLYLYMVQKRGYEEKDDTDEQKK